MIAKFGGASKAVLTETVNGLRSPGAGVRIGWRSVTENASRQLRLDTTTARLHTMRALGAVNWENRSSALEHIDSALAFISESVASLTGAKQYVANHARQSLAMAASRVQGGDFAAARANLLSSNRATAAILDDNLPQFFRGEARPSVPTGITGHGFGDGHFFG